MQQRVQLYLLLLVAAAEMQHRGSEAASPTENRLGATEQRLQSWPRKQPPHRQSVGGSQRAGAAAAAAAAAAEDSTLSLKGGPLAHTGAANKPGYYRDNAEGGAELHSLVSMFDGSNATQTRRLDDQKLIKLFYQKLGVSAVADDERRGVAAASPAHGQRPVFSEYVAVDAAAASDPSAYSNGDFSPFVAGDADAQGPFAGSNGWSPAFAGGGGGSGLDVGGGPARGAADAERGAGSSCPNCQLMREEALAFRIEAIKQDILSKLQLEKPPNVTQKQRDPRIPKHILWGEKFYDEQEDGGEEGADELDDEYATIQRVLKFAEKVPEEKMAPAADALYFEMPKQVVGARIKQARLSIFSYCLDDARLTINVKLFDAAPGSSKDPLATQKVTTDKKGRWVHMDVTALVESWSFDLDSNYGVIALVEAPNGAANVRLIGAADDGDRKAFIDIRMGGSAAGRRKRDLGLECTESSAEERCCRYPFTVDFDEFGPSFDFIITPRRYPANYCAGQCPPTFLPMHTNTQLTQVSRRLPANSRQPCCTPRKMEGVFMVYVDDYGTYMQGVLPGMTIKSCGCS